MGTKITGIGAYLPEKVVTREQLAAKAGKRYEEMPEEFFDVPANRRHATEAESGAVMGAQAVLSALEHAKVLPEAVDLVICASAMPDLMYPKDSHKIAMIAGLKNATAMEIDTACASFMSLLKLGTALIEQGMHKRIALVCVAHWTDRMFDPAQDFSPIGDSAGAVILEASDQVSLVGYNEIRDERFFDFVKLESPFVTKKPEYLRFAIDDAFRDLCKVGSMKIAKDLMVKTNVFPDKIDWFVPHMVGLRPMRGWCRSLELADSKLLTTYDWTGNCMMANMPTVMEHFIRREPTIKRGDTLLFFALASGFHGAAMLWRY